MDPKFIGPKLKCKPNSKINEAYFIALGGGGSLPLMLCNHVCTTCVFIGVIYLLIGF